MLSRLDMRWRLALMLCVITTINYLDRQALSIAAPSLMDEFPLSNTNTDGSPQHSSSLMHWGNC